MAKPTQASTNNKLLSFRKRLSSEFEKMLGSFSQRTRICLVALAFYFLTVFAVWLGLSEELCLALFCTTLVVGFLSFFVTAEAILNKSFGFELASVRWAAVSFVALIAFASKVTAEDDVNKLFFLDPQALPTTVLVATVLNIIKLANYFIGVLVAWSALELTAAFADKLPSSVELSRKEVGFQSAIVLVFGGIACIAISETLTEKRIPQIITRVAHKTDFISAFYCPPITPAYGDGLFLGPDHRRLLVAPRPDAPSNSKTLLSELLSPTKLPGNMKFGPVLKPDPTDMIIYECGAR